MSRILSTADVAKRCGVTRRTVARWVDAGVLPATYTTGGHRRIREDDLVDFMDSRRSLMARDRVSPGLRVVVLSERAETAGLFGLVASGIDPAIVVTTATTDLAGGLALADARPHLIVLEPGPAPAEDLVASLRMGALTSHAYIAVVGSPGRRDEGAHTVLPTPLLSESVRDALLAARAFRERA